MTDWTDSPSCSVADLVAQAANQFVSEQLLPGFHYFEEYAAYYNPESGYFYDPNSGLFYHPSTQCYYHLNEETNNYEEIYGGEDENNTTWTRKGFKKRAMHLLGENFVQNAAQDDVDIVELTLDLVDKCAFFAGDYCSRRLNKRALSQVDEEIDGIPIKRQPNNRSKSSPYQNYYSSSEDDEQHSNDNVYMEQEMARRTAEEEIARNAPCIRLIEQPKSLLHIITITGAHIGYARTDDIQLKMDGGAKPDQIGKSLFSITYSEGGEQDEKAGEYQLNVNCPDVSPIFINGEKVELTRGLCHDDWIQTGKIAFSVHIHNGTNTCQGCEPGLFAKLESGVNEETKVKKRSRNAERLRQIRVLKEQYGISDEVDADEMRELRGKYVDRAKNRRRIVGSCTDAEKVKMRNAAGGIYADCAAAPIPGCSTESMQLKSATTTVTKNDGGLEATNKGFQLLKGMGWKEGQGLGKNNQGIQGPIGTTLKNDRAGLGLPTTSSNNNNKAPSSSRQTIIELTKHRYEQIEEEEKTKKKKGNRD